MPQPPDQEPAGGLAAAETYLTSELLQRAQQGDRAALERLMERYLPRLQRWASGRLPAHARSLFDTEDLVQETLLRTIEGLDRVELGPGGFQAYVRGAVGELTKALIPSSRAQGASRPPTPCLPGGVRELREVAWPRIAPSWLWRPSRSCSRAAP